MRDSVKATRRSPVADPRSLPATVYRWARQARRERGEIVSSIFFRRVSINTGQNSLWDIRAIWIVAHQGADESERYGKLHPNV